MPLKRFLPVLGATRKISAAWADDGPNAIAIHGNDREGDRRQGPMDHAPSPTGAGERAGVVLADGVRDISRVNRLSISARTLSLSRRSVGRRSNGRVAFRTERPEAARTGASGSCGTLTSWNLTAQPPDGPNHAACVRATWRCDSRITLRMRLRTGEDGTSLRGMAIVSRGLPDSTAARATTTK